MPADGRRIVLVLGGARSGKSAFAEGLVRQASAERTYVATGRAWDDEMRERILQHRNSRGTDWTTIEEPLDLGGALQRSAGAVLVDCLTLWVTNLMMDEADCHARFAELADRLTGENRTIVLVSNEVGLGIVPMDAMSRAFRDHAGRLHQRIAAVADEVYLVTAGLPQKLK